MSHQEALGHNSTSVNLAVVRSPATYRQLCGSGCVCRPEFRTARKHLHNDLARAIEALEQKKSMSPGVQYHPVKENSVYLKPDESFVYIGGRVSIS